ncbi:uncharacterized protein LOC131614937 [Vicia villosa]|uniref:uncharacterized protein LOC131614937 n=1 Tax=Vicia villosa TaxID=3911 RepID=UPI00273B1494|nr:uncharacterized protein LOC131614937 [Vicia villosa]
MSGRQLLDGVLVANELVHFKTKEKKECFLFKVDFEKAYDKVSWSFLRFMLLNMGFGDLWLSWMEATVFSSKISILVNSGPTKELLVERGLRLGDPLSPFLFLIVVEALPVLVKRSLDLGEFAGFNINDVCNIDILQFDDDTLMVWDGNRKSKKESLWWRDLLKLNSDNADSNAAGISKLFHWKLGKGDRIPFWFGRWLGAEPLCAAFPNIFDAVENPKAAVEELGNWTDSVWHWDIHTALILNHGVEHSEIADLEALLAGISLNSATLDKPCWPWDSCGYFSVKSCYAKLLQGQDASPIDPSYKSCLNVVWDSLIPQKVKLFGWRLLRNRLATRDQLIRRGILEGDDNCRCPLCNSAAESSEHLFLRCNWSVRIWADIWGWLGILPLRNNASTNCRSHFLSTFHALNNKVGKGREVSVWLATCWCLWNARNGIIFNNETLDIDEILFKIKMLTWWWLQIGLNRLNCNFYEWFKNPLNFL